MHLIKLGLVYAACVPKLCVILHGPVVLPSIFAVFAVLASFEGAIFAFAMSRLFFTRTKAARVPIRYYLFLDEPLA